MVMDSGIMVNGFKKLEDSEPFFDHNNRADLPFFLPNSISPPRRFASPGPDSPEDTEFFSDASLNFISKMLLEEDIDDKFYMYPEGSALQAAEKPFYDIIGEKYPPSPDQPPLYTSSSSDSPDDSSSGQNGSISDGLVDGFWVSDFVEYATSQTHNLPVDYSSQSSFSSSNSVGNTLDSLEEYQFVGRGTGPDLFTESQPVWQFKKGVEEANKFLPNSTKMVISLEGNGYLQPHGPKEEDRFFVIKEEHEEREYSGSVSRGRKNPHQEDLDLEEGRSVKQSAVYSEDIRSEMFDQVLLCSEANCNAISSLRESLQNQVKTLSLNDHPKGSGSGKSRGKKQVKKELVDLRTLLIHCAQAVAADDRRSATELLKQIRQHSSPLGDGSQRLAHCFADGLEARLAGTGSQIYHSFMAKRQSASDILKAYRLYLAVCPFKKISYLFSNQTIFNIAEKATKLHIIDFGIYFGFQWPCLIQRLSTRPGGPPKLRITGIDVPQTGFRPAQRVEETGCRLADYAKTFDVPFEYHAIASKWENIRVEDLKIDRDEVLVVNSMFQFKHLVDETVVVDSPRSTVLNTIRKLNPDVFLHGIVNGAYSAPFFITRFREALFHFSAMFDMLDSNVPREHPERLLIEREIFGRDALNVIACEGSERVERPETYKQWQVRNVRAGFQQLPLNPDIIKIARDKAKRFYNKDFVVDEDSRWLLQGWKGRIIFAVSSWRPKRTATS